MRRLERRVLLSSILAVAACGRFTTESGTGGKRSDVQPSRRGIIGGMPETAYLAVFALAYDGEGGCTGTCITPKVGVTAAHCVEETQGVALSALFGESESQPQATLQVTATASEPQNSDIALVAFSGDCPATTPYNRATLENHIGEPVVMVGFGVTTEQAEDAGTKRSGTATLYSVDPEDVPGLEVGELATSNVPAGTCNGDSGGPTFMTVGGTEHVVGVTSRGSLRTATDEWPCGQGYSIAVRTDSHSPFIESFISQHDPGALTEADPPGGDDPAGTDADPSNPDDGDPGANSLPAGNQAPDEDRGPTGKVGSGSGAGDPAPSALESDRDDLSGGGCQETAVASRGGWALSLSWISLVWLALRRRGGCTSAQDPWKVSR